MAARRKGLHDPISRGQEVIVVEGLEEAQAYLAGLKLTDKDWKGPLEKAGRELVRYAASVSPIVTGSYANAHRAMVAGTGVTLFISPVARNTATGTLVSRYAMVVEGRHQVYAMAAVKGAEMGLDILDDVLEGKGV